MSEATAEGAKACKHLLKRIREWRYQDYETGYVDSGEIWKCSDCGEEFLEDEAKAITEEKRG